MKNEENKNFLKGLRTEDRDNTFELQEISVEGLRLRVEAEEVSEQMNSRMRPNILSPFKLKGIAGLAIGGILGTWGIRSAWQTYRGGNNDQPAQYKTGDITKSALATQPFFMPTPASLVMGQLSFNNSFFINTTNLDYYSILPKLFSQKFIYDVHRALPSITYYEDYIKPVFRKAISKATQNSHNGMLDVKLFRSLVIEYFVFLSNYFLEGTMMNSPGLCDLKKSYQSIYFSIIKEFNVSSSHYKILKHQKIEINLSRDAIDVSKTIDINSIYVELRSAIDFLIKTGSGKKYSSESELILKYARQAASDISLLSQSDPLEKLIYKNILSKLIHLNEKFYSEARTTGLWGRFTSHIIKKCLTFGTSSTMRTKLYTNLLIAHATIIPDLIGLHYPKPYKLTDVSILNSLLLDFRRERSLGVATFIQTSSITIPKVTEHYLRKPGMNSTTSRNSATSETNFTKSPTKLKAKNGAQIYPNHTGFTDEVILNASTTARPVDNEVLEDIIAAGAATLVAAGIFVGTGLLASYSESLSLQIVTLRGLVGNVLIAPDQQVRQPQEQPIVDWGQLGPSSRRDFIYPTILDELQFRAANSKAKFREYVNGNFGQFDISRMLEYRNSYLRHKIDEYGICFNEGYYVGHGLRLRPGEDQGNIREAKMMVADHLDFVNVAFKRTLRIFEIIFCKDKNSSVIMMAYLVDYFKRTLNINDDDIIIEALSRLYEVAKRGNNYLETMASNKFKNIWFISSYGYISKSSRVSDHITSLDSTRIRSLPMFVSIYSGEVEDSVITMFSEVAHPVNPEHPIPDFRYDTHHVGESLLHEITHISSTTEDYMYFENALNGRSKNAKEMMEQFYKNLKNRVISADLRHAIEKYCEIYEKPMPTDSTLKEFFDENPRFKAYIIMNNAPSYETFFRDISEVFPYDVDPWSSILNSRVPDTNTLGQMDVLNAAGPSGVHNLNRRELKFL